MKVWIGYNVGPYWARVHNYGCRDIKREKADSFFTTDAETRRDVIEEAAYDFIFMNDEQPWTDYIDEVSFAPCVDLPME